MWGVEGRWFCGGKLWEKVAFMGVFLGQYNLLIRGEAGNRKSPASSAVRRQTQTHRHEKTGLSSRREGWLRKLRKLRFHHPPSLI